MNIKNTLIFSNIKTVILLFLFFSASSAISQPFKPALDQLSGQYITGYPDWPAEGYVITNSGDSITGTITKSTKKFGFFLQSITLDGNQYNAVENKSFGFLAYLDEEKHFYITHNAPCESIPSLLRYDTQIDPKKNKKVFMWKMVDEPGLVVYQNPGFSFTHTVESGSTVTKMDSLKIIFDKEILKAKILVEKEKLKGIIIDLAANEILELYKSLNIPLDDIYVQDILNELKAKAINTTPRTPIYDNCGNIIGYLNDGGKSILRTDVFSHPTYKGLEEDYFYNAYYLVAKDGELIKLNKKNYLDQWEYLWKGCKAVDDFVNGKKNYDKIKKFMRLVSLYSQQCI